MRPCTPPDPAIQPGRYLWLLFDADGTLFDYDRAESAALGQCLGQIGAEFSPASLAAYRQINSSLWQALERGETTPGALKVRRFELLLRAIGVSHSPAAFSEMYLEALAGCAELVEGAAELLEELHRCYRLAIVTNGLRAVQRGRLARSRIRDQVEELIISEEIGHAKPAPEFFAAAFARLGNPSRREVLMIGDNWSSDIVGAAGYGIDACWYNPGRQPRPPEPPILLEIASLRELPAWLARPDAM
jgi:2-haloacid dehalogenase